jgi:hypothetical protein
LLEGAQYHVSWVQASLLIWLVAVVALPGCGRIGFDLFDSNDPDAGLSIDDGGPIDADVSPDARVIDAGVTPFIGPDQELTNFASNPVTQPVIAWNGLEYVLAFSGEDASGRFVYRTRIAAGGTVLGTDQVSTLNWGTNPSIASAGTNIVIGWEQTQTTQDVYFSIFSQDGTALKSEVALPARTLNAREPDVVWMGTGYAFAWEESLDGSYDDMELWVSYSDIDGNAPSPAQLTSVTGPSGEPAIAWADDRLGVVWEDEVAGGSRSIYFRMVDGSGSPIGATNLNLSSGSVRESDPDIAWSGTEFGVVWHAAGGLIRFARVDTSGARIGNILQLHDSTGASRYVSISWTGQNYLITWNEDIATDRLWAALVGNDGAQLGSNIEVASSTGVLERSFVTWNEYDNEAAVVWTDSRDGISQVYFKRFRP